MDIVYSNEQFGKNKKHERNESMKITLEKVNTRKARLSLEIGEFKLSEVWMEDGTIVSSIHEQFEAYEVDCGEELVDFIDMLQGKMHRFMKISDM